MKEDEIKVANQPQSNVVRNIKSNSIITGHSCIIDMIIVRIMNRKVDKNAAE